MGRFLGLVLIIFATLVTTVVHAADVTVLSYNIPEYNSDEAFPWSAGNPQRKPHVINATKSTNTIKYLTGAKNSVGGAIYPTKFRQLYDSHCRGVDADCNTVTGLGSFNRIDFVLGTSDLTVKQVRVIGYVPLTTPGSSGFHVCLRENNELEFICPSDHMAVFTKYQLPFVFKDVPPDHISYSDIMWFYNNSFTTDCGSGNFCPDSHVTREQAAVFLLRLKHGRYYQTAVQLLSFSDIAGRGLAHWDNQFGRQGITSSCGGGRFCPTSILNREQISVFLLRSKFGSSYSPLSTVGYFSDVLLSHPFVRWIDDLKRKNISSGCGGGKFCPTTLVTRA